MAANKLPIKLTDEQPNQIRQATGRSITELNLDVAATGQLTEADLGQVAGESIQFGARDKD
jgi:propanediol dehydratase small subunit